MNEKYWGEKKLPAKKDAQSTPPDKHIAVNENKIYYYAGVDCASFLAGSFFSPQYFSFIIYPTFLY
jgi:hypothetical protein